MIFAFVILLPNPAFAQTQPSEMVRKPEPLTVSATYSEAGPYGEFWVAYLAPDGDLSVRVHHQKSGVMGQTISTYVPDDARIAALYRSIEDTHFFEISHALAPPTAQFHRPFYNLSVTLGAKQYSVTVDDPKAIGASEEVSRFFTVWDTLFSKLPFNPKVDAER